VKRIGSDINLVFHKVFCFSCGVDLLSDAFEIIAKSLIDQKKKKTLSQFCSFLALAQNDQLTSFH